MAATGAPPLVLRTAGRLRGPSLRRFPSVIDTRRATATVLEISPPSPAAAGFDLETYMAARGRRVEEALEAAVPLLPPAKIHSAMRYSLLAGGKRVRPILTLAASELVGGGEAAVMPFACAVEMIHTMSLVHDDLPCVDDGHHRRGRPANHRVFGDAAAVLAGDALIFLAFEHIAARTAGDVPPERILRAVAELAAAAGSGGMIAGQIVDLDSERKEVGREVLEYIHVQKTARLIEAAAVAGAIVGGGNDGEVERIKRYARCVGLLFQVVDDVLDATRTAEELGKTAGRDLTVGKATYPKLLGMAGSREFACQLVKRSEEELAGFDAERAAPLYHLARFVACREH
ncbi:Geranylgeranyl pyrophosphate synthase, chloroplastic [Apostasia shenzhenica]|uniref:Geranylgeranyl pyrophosphate synthase, chloroplastic n=1 Tax=Apostasia shenzhenica TaxID=1088818 RepID=A0A2I0AR49_9ASPA|nr:Geranylgeranyl pyrophosphate synthase, chloroplastic [Apostasia shenzhenica]